MKRLLFAFFLLPQLAYAQYNARCFNMDSDKHNTKISVGCTLTSDTTLIIGGRSEITGFSVSGRATLNSDDGYIRILLKDNYNYEYLVYEDYMPLTDERVENFQNIAIETQGLYGITPLSIRVELYNATLQLDSYSFVTASESNKNPIAELARIQTSQHKYIIDQLNENLKKQNLTWRAGATAVSKRSYEEKKSMFGGIVPQLYGLEYYIGGIYVMPGVERDSLNRQNTYRPVSYASEWDWRNRHGKNWMTNVKYHVNCGACWAFASISAIEAYANLYFNKLINLDLSEQEIVSCSVQDGCRGGTEYAAFNYVKDNGVVEESCFPFADAVLGCSNKCSNPDEKVFIQNHRNIPIVEDSVKTNLFNCPLTMAIGAWRHSMVIAGYKTIEVGDKIYFGNYLGNNSNPDSVVINSADHQNLIGKTAWLLKNSWQAWGDNGYLYAVVDMNYPYVWRVQSLVGKIFSLNFSDSDIVCEDADGDGYYFWGLGPKPSWCPSWIPDTKDGNDDDSTKGSMDQYGNLESLNTNLTYTINGNVAYSTPHAVYTNLRISPYCSLTVNNTMNMFGKVNIVVEPNGQLIIDGGVVTNADIRIMAGGKLIIRNGGVLVIQTGKDFNVPLNAILDIDDGKILNSNDF